MSFSLRPYQNKILDEIRGLMRQGVKSICVTSPTGSGKTVLVAHMLKTAESRGMASFFIVHRRELIWQSTRTFSDVGVRHGIIAAGFPEDRRPLVQIASIQTLARRLDKCRKPTLIIWDESHHCAAATWDKLHSTYPDAYHIGLTATPCRLDGKGLGKYFSRLVHGPSVEWLIENKYLSPYKLFAPSTVNLAGLRTRMGDWDRGELVQRVDRPTITGDAIIQYRKHADGKRALIFAVSIEHSKHIVEQFNASGISAAHIDGETHTVIRDSAIENFKDGKIKILSNVDLCGEGFDLPSLEAAILLRPTASLGCYLQQLGRTLRTYPGKDTAIILDHVGACERHGLPDDERTWTLEDGIVKKKNNGQAVSVRICPKCFCAQRPGPACPHCGYVYEVKSRQVDHKEGELIEIDKVIMRKHRLIEQGKARTMAELIALGRRRGYKYPERWAWFLTRNRQAKKLAGV